MSSTTKNSRLSSARFANTFFIVPSLLLLYLSIPRIYLLTIQSDFGEQFSASYQVLNINFVFLLLSVFFSIGIISSTASKVVFLLLINAVFLIRMIEVGLRLNFDLGFCPIVFDNMDWDAVWFAVRQYGFEWIVLVLFCSAFSWFFLRLLSISPLTRMGNVVVTVVFILLGARAVYVLYRQHWHSFEDIASLSFMRQVQAYRHVKQRQYRFAMGKEEEELLGRLGINLSMPDIPEGSKEETSHPNLILVYLESFQTNFTEAGKTPYKGLTPNIDDFIHHNTFVPNFYNAVTPTVNAAISSLCGILPELDSTYLRENPEYTRDLLCLTDILRRFGYRQLYYSGYSAHFGGLINFLTNHHYDVVRSHSDFFVSYPRFKNRQYDWGVQDTDAVEAAIDALERLKSDPPFHLSLFLNGTHAPGYSSEECPRYDKDDRYLNAIHCVDFAFGKLQRYLEGQSFLNETIIVLMGDHTVFLNVAGESKKLKKGFYGRTLFAFRSPDRVPSVLETTAYTPDVAPTILELLGINIRTLYAGQSLLSRRKMYQRLIAPGFELFSNEQLMGDSCRETDLRRIHLSDANGPMTDCQRRKIVFALNRWIRSVSNIRQRQRTTLPETTPQK
ncbi:MAG: LTA synthase family protein [Proteobacteria bacterium]|nr:LTA synthase family protein [Pseudomonadota bacterium]